MLAPNILSIFLCLQTAAGIPFVINSLTGISYQGTSADGVDQFQNIFYAEDTSGANRFAPPVPYLPTRGSTIQATAAGFVCPQPLTSNPIYPFSSPNKQLSEDCLSLRIARPANHTSDKPLPVMVWTYGGGWIYGQAYDREYNPVGLVQESVAGGHPVIYVAINYRVGIFGFAVSEALHDAKSENVGLRDQRLALQWVKDNIAAFGGDPDNITAFGQSAGSINTNFQLLAFGGKQGAVFQKAIMDSGFSTVGDWSAGTPSNVTASVARSLNCNGDADAELACLREIPLGTLLPAALAQAKIVAPPSGVEAFHPVIDGDFIPDQPSRLIQEGSFAKGISVMASWTADDGSQFVPTSVNSEATVVAFFSGLFSSSNRDRLLKLYPVEEFEAQVTKNSTITAQYYRASRIYRDYRLACPAINLTSEISRQSTNRTYLFTFNSTRLQPVWDSLNESQWRIAHTSDIPYLFNEAIVGGDNSESALQLSAEASRSYSAFATYGSPSIPVFDWPVAWSGQRSGNATVFVIGGPYGSGPATLGPISGPRRSAAVRRGLAVRDQSIKVVTNSTSAEIFLTNYQRSEALAQEKLVERCAFLDSVSF